MQRRKLATLPEIVSYLVAVSQSLDFGAYPNLSPCFRSSLGLGWRLLGHRHQKGGKVVGQGILKQKTRIFCLLPSNCCDRHFDPTCWFPFS